MNQISVTYTGFLNVFKEAGFTSADVVAKLRGILHQKKIGHLGTLDPNARGVLPIALGRATKAISLLEDHTKEYEAGMFLGRETDTLDVWGETVALDDVKVSEEKIQEALSSFVGESMQTPPMYSAKKVNGKRLYELAREGSVIERKAVPIYIEEIHIKSIKIPEVIFTVSCSKGTYIRSLIHDTGKKLGCGACMSSLLRTRAGQFMLKDAHTLSEIQEWADTSERKNDCPFIIPIDDAFRDIPSFICKKEYDKAAANGVALNIDYVYEIVDSTKMQKSQFMMRDHSIVRMYLSDNQFLGIYNRSGKKFYPRKVFL